MDISDIIMKYAKNRNPEKVLEFINNFSREYHYKHHKEVLSHQDKFDIRKYLDREAIVCDRYCRMYLK